MKKYSLFLLLFGIMAMNTSFRVPYRFDTKHPDKNSFTVLISKSKYSLTLFDAHGQWISSYPVVFGSKDLGDKMMQGDRKTPEGTFHIVAKRKHEKWNRFISIDYPNAESVEKFNIRKAEGLIPANAKIGGETERGKKNWHVKNLSFFMRKRQFCEQCHFSRGTLRISSL